MIHLDARGLRCPLPVIRLATLARDHPPGTEIEILTTDPAALPDIAAWCRMRTHTLLLQEAASNGSLRHVVRLATYPNSR